MNSKINPEEISVSNSNYFKLERYQNYHSNYISLFLIESILSFFLGYYLWYKAKNNIKSTRLFKENLGIQSKYEVFYYLAIANLSKYLMR